jgi:hypothetical protein
MDGGLQPELNRRLIARIDPARNCAVDGLRHIVDFESLSVEFAGRFFLAFIECTPDLRWEHVKLKGRILTNAEFQGFDDHLVEQRIDDLRKNAYAVVPNTGSPRDLQQQVDSVLGRLTAGGQL